MQEIEKEIKKIEKCLESYIALLYGDEVSFDKITPLDRLIAIREELERLG